MFSAVGLDADKPKCDCFFYQCVFCFSSNEPAVRRLRSCAFWHHKALFYSTVVSDGGHGARTYRESPHPPPFPIVTPGVCPKVALKRAARCNPSRWERVSRRQTFAPSVGIGGKSQCEGEFRSGCADPRLLHGVILLQLQSLSTKTWFRAVLTNVRFRVPSTRAQPHTADRVRLFCRAPDPLSTFFAVGVVFARTVEAEQRVLASNT